VRIGKGEPVGDRFYTRRRREPMGHRFYIGWIAVGRFAHGQKKEPVSDRF
jgi:hypothetical protein